MSVKVAMIGFGGVGQSFAEIVNEKQKELQQKYGLEVEIVAVSDVKKGAVYQSDGLNIPKLLDCVRRTGSLENYPETSQTIKGWSSLETIEQSNADVIIEVTYTDVKTGEPALTHCHRAFDTGKSVITTNKGPVALAYKELIEKAEDNEVFFGFEGTVMSGTPALRLPSETLAGNEIREIKGVLNGTTNYILTAMEEGMEFNQALEKAQALGYAEADPTSDLEGYDVRYKAAILSNHVFGVPLDPKDIFCAGITGLTAHDINEAAACDEKWKLLARIRQGNGVVTASVQPERIKNDDLLAGIMGATNAIVYECDLSGPIMLTGSGAGLKETGFSLLIDLIHCHKRKELSKT
ncbi:homoserine dehydrogenase [Halobacillus karajensis]|uniref:Homoserine dehydrogenase n=1 Tax=Halobacillus karajensis TaxID=195088 RepID=A0A059NX69_9BACI|nr:homoserine dehydrogenase [Halobacillus karajensis]CDQ18625.1 Homoserine dehydrogenase [Halobacillus karajensis]CDQ23303.1 Homoserine dehydrogenase [Halobacillus karajensis]CDQ26785.1 Homoserine dehydrogenase [Halobacillus karajensis]SEH48970.1 homoserine dehydrogenase [Halobacillus karajensis]